MRILFVHEVSWYNKVVFEMHDIPELLSLRGHDVYFLDFDEGRQHAKWRLRTSVESRAHPGSRVTVVTPPRIFPGILGRLFAVLLQPLVFLLLLKRIQPNVVVTYSIPTSGWQVTLLCNLRKIPVIVRSIDVSHELRPSRLKILVKWSESLVYSRADFVSTHNEPLRQYVISLGASETSSSVIHPGVDFRRFQPTPPRVELRDSLGIQESDKVLLFMGTLFRFSGVTELLYELKSAFSRDQSLKFLILGDGEDADRIATTVAQEALRQQVVMTGKIDYDSLGDYLRLAHVALLPFKPDTVTHFALPGKVLQYLAAGLPTVATPLRGLCSLVPHDYGIVYAPTTKLLAEEAVKLASDRNRQQEIAQRGLELMLELCDWEKQIDAFEYLLKRYARGL